MRLSQLPLAAALLVALVAGLAPGATDAEEKEIVPAKVTVRWKALDSDGNYGYIVYRAEQREGPYLRVSPKIVLTPADGAKEHAYVFEDTAVKPGTTYFYYVDTIDTKGIKRRFSGVLPKTVPGAEASPAGS